MNYQRVIVDKRFLQRYVNNVQSNTGRVFSPPQVRTWNSQKWLDEVPPLCKADVSVMRWKIVDVLPQITDYTITSCQNLDHITMLNAFVYSIVFPKEFVVLAELGVWQSRESLLNFGKAITPDIKRIRCSEDERQPYSEIHSLAGYQQSEPEGWSMEDDVLALANAGKRHGLLGMDWDLVFDRALRYIAAGRVSTRPAYMTFEDFVHSGKWITSGSSSIGSVEWEMDGKTGHFKARKNMLTALYTTEELVNMVHTWNRTLYSRAFIKPELAKRRVAVASNIESYLNDSYVLYLMGHGYKNWVGVTLDETRNQEQQRVRETMIKMANGCWALPFDYASFDHQPTTSEIVKVIRFMTKDIDVRAQVYVTNMIVSYSNSYIWYQSAEKTATVKVTGGLPSGVRPTSLIGNIWNAAVCAIAIDITNSICQTNLVDYYRVRGDDSYFISNSCAALCILRLTLAGINAQGSNAKFGICNGYVEFLRTNISACTVRGWACRTIPTISQRKPWNPEPWSPVSETATLVNGVETIERRVMRPMPTLHQIIKVRFSRISKISSRWLTIPRRSGGFGLYNDVGWRSRSRLPTASRHLFNVKPTAVIDRPAWISKYNTSITNELYTQSFLSTTIATDDIPGTTSLLRGPYIYELRKVKTDFYKVGLPYIEPYVGWKLTSLSVVPIDKPQVFHSTDGKYTLMDLVSEYGIASQVGKLPSLMSIVKVMLPAAYNNIKGWTIKGWHITDAIDLACGDKPIARLPGISPLLNGYAKEIIWKDEIPARWKGRELIASKLYSSTYSVAAVIAASQLNLCYLY